MKMDFSYDTTFASGTPEAYERLLLDAMTGEPSLFIRADEVEASWKLIDSVRLAWDNTAKPPLIEYPCGSWGPAEADGLFANPYERWHPIA